ncbi:MAG: carbonic anhydrase [Nitrospina sp.]|jgi:carbonic anhydrase|nr:carbonic anhydrase [Nitrospina sp.]MBT3510495.1 carbonic anhydrase [Nitrospina sp.]MBT3875744.1 carbonic anhydrase [Nitrospina sp.]MBT4049191.1 carbonic anhydrase [Nitrospina sp.]MBT4557160.1 carbonic anhydrase [Nitrospina sp.]
MEHKNVIKKLLEGNQRYITGGALHPNQSFEHRIELTKGQKPIAAILTCADSRVSPEIIFDQGLGDLFVLRVAGNVINDMFIGSLEYAVEHLNVSLLMVLGHSQCGAVDATIKGGNPPGHINSLVQAIKPALDRLKKQSPDWVNIVAKENVKIGVERLRTIDPILTARYDEGDIDIVGAFYDIKSGKVSLTV